MATQTEIDTAKTAVDGANANVLTCQAALDAINMSRAVAVDNLVQARNAVTTAMNTLFSLIS